MRIAQRCISAVLLALALVPLATIQPAHADDVAAPSITVSVTPQELWPPNGQLVTVTISGRVTDTGGSGVNRKSGRFSVQDEYEDEDLEIDGRFAIAANGNFSFTVQLEADRDNSDENGRRYTITLRVSDNAGNVAKKRVFVFVPHSQD
jgi:hypothetical protein